MQWRITEGLTRCENWAEGGPLDIVEAPPANIQKKKNLRNNSESGCGGKTFQKRKKTTTYWKPKEYWITKYKLSGARFLQLAC